LIPYIASQDAIGSDHTFYRSVGQRWLDSGVYYLPRQLSGPYVVQPDVDMLYPPLGLLLFVPLVWLPFPLWWIVPGVIVALTLWRLRPALWTWPIMAALFAWPRGVSNLIYGNSDMWIATVICGGLLIAWPAVLVLVKPSVLPFAFIGIRHRSWWIGACLLALLSLFMLPLWGEFAVAIRNSDAEWYYSLDDMPPLFIPVIAWLGRHEVGSADLGELGARIRAIRLPALRRSSTPD
ncbi:MAG: hypothetical protein ACXWWR_06445, partial [Candidatus Limnocylindrales bacterium]